MLGAASVYDDRQHALIPRHEILDFCVRETNGAHDEKDLFLYHHEFTGNFVIGKWLDRRRLFVDLMNLGPSLGGFTRQKAQEFVQRTCNRPSAKEKQQDLIKIESDHLSKLQDENEEEKERITKYREAFA